MIIPDIALACKKNLAAVDEVFTTNKDLVVQWQTG